MALVHYTGAVQGQPPFVSTRDNAVPNPFPIRIGKGTVVAGLEEGVKGMRIGERRLLTIPPWLAYGKDGRAPKIPPDATLVFDVELVDLRPDTSPPKKGPQQLNNSPRAK